MTHCPAQLHVPLSFLFSSLTSTRCNLIHVAKDCYKIEEPRSQPSPTWLTLPEMPPPRWIQWISGHLQDLHPSYVARPYTDGSYDPRADILGYFRPQMARIPSSAAIIIKDDTTSWRSKPILAVYISDGHTIHSESVYSMEFLALAGALQLSVFNIDTIHATGCDAKGVLNSIPKRRDRLQHVMRDHHFLLQSIDNSLFRGAPMPYHVRGHAEDRKPGKDSRGLLGKDWTKDDWGNWIADRIAAQDLKILRDRGLHIIHSPPKNSTPPSSIRVNDISGMKKDCQWNPGA